MNSHSVGFTNKTIVNPPTPEQQHEEQKDYEPGLTGLSFIQPPFLLQWLDLGGALTHLKGKK